MIMKTFIRMSAVVFLYVLFASHTWTGSNVGRNCYIDEIQTLSAKSTNDVIITYNKSDVCGLSLLAEVKVTEKWWFYCNNNLKAETKAELERLSLEKGGNIVYVDIKEKKGFGIFFSTTIIGNIYKK